ncbi:MAG: hypothetical protein AAFY74_17005 [Pseudomonadota bacterium]
MGFLAEAGFAQSLAGSGSKRVPLIEARGDASSVALAPGSLFADRHERGLFAPLPENEIAARLDLLRATRVPGIHGLKNLIASAEAGRDGYDAVQYGARIRPTKPPTRMTLGEIYDWIDATPGQPHAIGRYQFIPSTLRRLAARTDAGRSQRFTPEFQDRMAMILLEEAGIMTFMTGDLSRTGFMNNLAKIWAGLPNSSGQSHYHGYAGNHATMSWARFEAEMARIFPG